LDYLLSGRLISAHPVQRQRNKDRVCYFMARPELFLASAVLLSVVLVAERERERIIWLDTHSSNFLTGTAVPIADVRGLCLMRIATDQTRQTADEFQMGLVLNSTHASNS
jgi:hypothetical protein